MNLKASQNYVVIAQTRRTKISHGESPIRAPKTYGLLLRKAKKCTHGETLFPYTVECETDITPLRISKCCVSDRDVL